ncbi:hypothetical protein [Nocardia sp. NPDC056100]|uniref:hypothetical protein n=1 Tax=Nocardia sp. NPDC056100 TaxID=3345712 RepID=UPI0035DCC4B6
MLVWRDIFTGDDVISDSFEIAEAIDAQGSAVPGMFRVDSKIITRAADEKVNNVIDEQVGFGYTQTYFETKAELKAYLKQYFVRILNHLKGSGASGDEIDRFESDAVEILKFLNPRFKDLQYYMFRSMAGDGGMAFAYYEPESHTPTFLYIRWGLEEVKS